MSDDPFDGLCPQGTCYSCDRSRRTRANELMKEITPRTQKATGVITLVRDGWRVPRTEVIQEAETLRDQYDRFIRERGVTSVFARPCPVRPRHGFVDSRRVETFEEVEELFKAAKENDPEAELMLCQTIAAEWNAIWVPGRIVIGPGNDGATGGHNSFTISLAAPNPVTNQRMQKLCASARIKDPDVPYIEIVADNKDTYPYFTQIRGGPALPNSGPDYVPEPMRVEHVVEAEGDLLEWEDRARKFKPGTAVWHPGGSMASHYAVHCVLNRIPILTSAEPKVGDMLAPTATLPPINMKSVLRGIAAGTVLKISSNMRRGAVAALLAGLHNVTAFSANDGFWLGAGAALMLRLGGVALMGEARHARNPESRGRDQIYNIGLERPFNTRRRLRRAQWMFTNYPWGGGYGGAAWRRCGTALFGLDEATRQFVREPRDKHFKALVSALNNAVNQAHNGGWWLNKFCEPSLMDEAARGDPQAVASGIYVMGQLTRIPAREIDTALVNWGVAQPLPKVTRMRGGTVVVKKLTLKVTQAQVKFAGDMLHVQFKIPGYTHYLTKNIPLNTVKFKSLSGKTLEEVLAAEPDAKSWGSENMSYHPLIASGANNKPHKLYLTKSLIYIGDITVDDLP